MLKIWEPEEDPTSAQIAGQTTSTQLTFSVRNATINTLKFYLKVEMFTNQILIPYKSSNLLEDKNVQIAQKKKDFLDYENRNNKNVKT